jgi:hypothetical protein
MHTQKLLRILLKTHTHMLLNVYIHTQYIYCVLYINECKCESLTVVSSVTERHSLVERNVINEKYFMLSRLLLVKILKAIFILISRVVGFNC